MTDQKDYREAFEEAEALVALVRIPTTHIAFRRDHEREALRFARETLPIMLRALASDPPRDGALSSASSAPDGGEGAALAHASSATTNPQESSGRLVDARDAERFAHIANTAYALRDKVHGRSNAFVWSDDYPSVGAGRLENLRIQVDQAIDQAIAGRRADGNG